MGPTPITSSIKTATPCGWLFLWLLVEGSRRADQKKPQWGFFPPPGSASQRLRSPQGKQPAACAETPITSTRTSFSVPRSLDKLGMTKKEKTQEPRHGRGSSCILLSYFTFSNTAVFASTVRELVKSPVAPQRASKVPSGRSTVMGASLGLATR